ncbi:MAG: GAF domain-containing protein [Candidatus Eisenbacteria bacterium]|nr:GAF domain-containing protein [Candidatus Eisenbacteria bacterium]
MTELLHSLEARRLIDELASQVVVVCDAVLARVWLIGPGDECPACPMRPECPSQIRCLHMASSAGATTRIDGAFRRFPLGARQVGEVAMSGAPFAASAALSEAGLAEESWLVAYRVRGFAAVPMRSGSRILGVVAVFSRRSLGDDEVRLLQLAASQSARAIEALTRPGAVRATPDATARARGDREMPEVLTLDEAQRRAIARAIAAAGGRVSGERGAAELLGLHANTLISRMIRLGMRRRKSRR